MFSYYIKNTILALFLHSKTNCFFFVFAFFYAFSTNIAQTLPEIPPQFNPEVAADYAPYEASILQIINYTEKHRTDKNNIPQKEAIAFAIQWLAGSPNVKITIEEPFIMPILKHKKLTYGNEMLIQYMFGMTKIVLENKEKMLSETAIQTAGISTLVDFYKDLNSKPRVKRLRKYKRLERRNKLEKWVGKKLRKLDEKKKITITL